MPKINEMYPSKWLKANDCEDGDLVLTIDRIVQEEIGPTRDRKWVLYFIEIDKGLVLNKTNTNTIAKLCGDDTDDWEGKKIILFATETDYQGQTVDAIRVRSKTPREKSPTGKKPNLKDLTSTPVDEIDGEGDDKPPF